MTGQPGTEARLLTEKRPRDNRSRSQSPLVPAACRTRLQAMNSSQPTIPLSVWYDGDCPVCRQEVAFYRKVDRKGRIAWIDIVDLADSELPQDKSRSDLLGRFHAREGQGPWLIGVDAFAAAWDRLPLFNRLAFVFRTPGLRQVADAAYRGFLRWQRGNRARREAEARAPG